MKGVLIICVLFVAACSDDPYDPALGPRNPRPGAEKYFTGRRDLPEDQKAALLHYKPCSQEFLSQLADVPSREVRSFVAANPSINESIMEKLIHDKEPGVRGYLARNPHVPRSVLLRLREDSDKNVRWGLPGNPNWTADDIRQMYRDRVTSPSVIARNPSAPSDVLQELSASTDYNILIALANNPSISRPVVLTLAKQKKPSIRKMITYNPTTPDDVLQSLTEDSDEDVRRYALLALQRRIRTEHKDRR
jgi:hypothetical protein